MTAQPQKPARRVDSRFLQEAGPVGLTGNELLMKGALEGGVALLTGYPGSPISGIFEAAEHLAPYLDELGLVAQLANSEALAAARLSGAQQAGLRAMAAMKSVGFHVAADALATGNLVEFRRPEGGAIVVVGDDPWNESTQINSDSRYLSMHLNMPVIEAGSLQEIKDFVGAGLAISGASDLFVTYVITTNQADGGGAVEARPNVAPPLSRSHRGHVSSDAIVTGDVIMIPPFMTQREASLADRYRRLHARSRELGLDRRFGPAGPAPVGFVTSGLSSGYLQKVLELAGLWGRVPVLKYGVTFPIDADPLLLFAADVQRVVVVEEKRGFLEAQVAQILAEAQRSGRMPRVPEIWGKRFGGGRPGFPSVSGMNPSVVLEVLGPELLAWRESLPGLEADRIAEQLARVQETGNAAGPIPRRTPTFCPGCPHRDSAMVALDLKRKLKEGRLPSAGGPVDVVVHGESGCHTMLGFAPFSELMQNYVGMGLGGGAGAGMAPFVDNKHLVFLGDSTFFHSGIVAISDSIKNNVDITYVLLANGTTAMTGHQPTAGTAVDIMGRPTATQDIERILRGMVPQGLKLLKLNPGDRDAYERILAEVVPSPGVKVIVADKECAITLNRRKSEEHKREVRERGFLAHEQRIAVDPEVCENCLECARQTACPGLAVVDTALGQKIATDLTLCVDDGACYRTRACPSFARVTIERRGPPVKRPLVARESAPLPDPVPLAADTWSAYLGGVGGMGIGVLTGIVARAGELDGYYSHFVNRNGLAIRNGGVYGHVVLSKSGSPGSPFGFYGEDDLLLGVDLLEACRGVHPAGNLRVAHPQRTRAVVNLRKHQTVLSQSGIDTLDVDALSALLRSRTRADANVFADYSAIAEAELGSRVYANVMLLGVAFQNGWTPLSESAIVRSIEQTVRASDREANLRAFRIGRALAIEPGAAAGGAPTRFADAVTGRAVLLERESGAATAAAYRRVAEAAGAEFGELPEADRVFLAAALANLVRYAGLPLAERYLDLVRGVAARDGRQRDFEATRMALSAFLQLLAPKDEFFVARLLTSPEKRERDQRRYELDPARDSLSYSFMVRPRITLFGRTIELGVAASPWMLRLVARASFLRSWIPGWHHEDAAFLHELLEAIAAAGDDYELVVKMLATGDSVRGFRAVRLRNLDAARLELEALRRQAVAREPAEASRGRVAAGSAGPGGSAR